MGGFWGGILGLEFRVSGFGVWGLGFGVQGLGRFWVWGRRAAGGCEGERGFGL